MDLERHRATFGLRDQVEAGNPPEANPTNSPSSPKEPESFCEEDFSFEPTYLPKGFSREVFPGAFPGGRPLDDLSGLERGAGRKDQVIVHYRGSDSRAIEIRRPGTLFAELAQGDDAPTIDVLGTSTTGFAPIQPGGDDFIVQFTYPPRAGPHDWCSYYSLNEYGVSLSELKKVAQGLRLRN